MANHSAPKFPFTVPKSYLWLVDRGLVGFQPFSPLQPWYFLPATEAFSVSERWPRQDTASEIYAFARRQDCDDLACFSRDPDGLIRVLVVHGWTAQGYEIVASCDSIWSWLKVVIDDIEEWATDQY